MKLNRRAFIGTGAAAAAALSAPHVRAASHGKPKVVVIGGGAGGATAARYLAKDSKGEIDVTLVEPTRTYYTCFFSNLYIGGYREFSSLGHSYGGLAASGVNVIHDWATGVDRGAKTVTLAGGAVLPYDRLILSPGIDFVDGAVPGWDVTKQNKMPHAYKAGSQTELLKAQLEAMPQGGVFAMIAPPNPYRCPPAPYERVCMVAHVLSQVNPTAKIMILDPKDSYSKQTLFENGWLKYYDGMVEWVNPEFGGADVAVRPETMEVLIEGEAEAVDVCNVIPAQKAGRIVELAGLSDESGWAPIDPANMRSRLDTNAWVLGDSANASEMPKSAVAANSQAAVVVQSLLGDLAGRPVPSAVYVNTCWSVIAPEDSVKVGGAYEPAGDHIASTGGFISQPHEDAETRRLTYEESFDWYEALTTDIFG